MSQKIDLKPVKCLKRTFYCPLHINYDKESQWNHQKTFFCAFFNLGEIWIFKISDWKSFITLKSSSMPPTSPLKLLKNFTAVAKILSLNQFCLGSNLGWYKTFSTRFIFCRFNLEPWWLEGVKIAVVAVSRTRQILNNLRVKNRLKIYSWNFIG